MEEDGGDGAQSSIFGGAKPVDTLKREKEMEERLQKEKEKKEKALEEAKKNKPSAASIFGSAKPVDTTQREKEVEEKLSKLSASDANKSEERNMRIDDVCVMKDSNTMRGEWRLCRVVEVYPDKEGIVRNVKVELKRHVSNFIVIHPQGDGVNDDDTGHGRVCTDGSGATAVSVSARANNHANQ